MSKVVSADQLNDHYIAYEIEAPDIASRVEPGQLLEVGLGQAIVLPHAIADFSRDKGTITVVARNRANGDKPSSTIDLGVVVGRHREVKGIHKILCVAEGLGVAALYSQLQELRANNIYAVVVAGFVSKDHVYWIDRLDSISNELYVVTEDGGYGIKGPIRQTVKGVCEHELDIDRALITGSLHLLRACCGVTEKYGIPTWISVNAALAEGAGEPPDGTAQVTDFDWSTASDLDGHKVDFNELTQKLGIAI